MRPHIVTDTVAWCRGLQAVGLLVGLSVTLAKTAKPIEMPFGLWTRVGSKKNALDWRAHWRHQANTI